MPCRDEADELRLGWRSRLESIIAVLSLWLRRSRTRCALRLLNDRALDDVRIGQRQRYRECKNGFDRNEPSRAELIWLEGRANGVSDCGLLLGRRLLWPFRVLADATWGQQLADFDHFSSDHDTLSVERCCGGVPAGSPPPLWSGARHAGRDCLCGTGYNRMGECARALAVIPGGLGERPWLGCDKRGCNQRNRSAVVRHG